MQQPPTTFALVALAMINLAIGTQGFAFAGVLSELARDLGITIGQAGLIVGASSITFAVGAPVTAGPATAFVGALATVAAASLVPPEKRGRAFAIVLGGLSVAFVLGVPLGSVVVGLYGWRATFAMSAIVCLLSLVLIAASVPRTPPIGGVRPKFADVLSNTWSCACWL